MHKHPENEKDLMKFFGDLYANEGEAEDYIARSGLKGTVEKSIARTIERAE